MVHATSNGRGPELAMDVGHAPAARRGSLGENSKFDHRAAVVPQSGTGRCAPTIPPAGVMRRAATCRCALDLHQAEATGRHRAQPSKVAEGRNGDPHLPGASAGWRRGPSPPPWPSIVKGGDTHGAASVATRSHGLQQGLRNSSRKKRRVAAATGLGALLADGPQRPGVFDIVA